LGIYHDGWSVHLVESRKRKCEFLETAIVKLNLESRFTVHCMPAEEAEQLREIADIVTCRAVAAIPISVELCAPLAKPGGSIVLWTTSAQDHSPPPPAVAGELGVGPEPIIRATPGEARESAQLTIWEKRARTNDRFPRRTGVARKRPLWS
jgi:16S rRNA (guanine527-N7)-methyltransferase